MTIGQAINRLIEEWEASKKSEYVRKPVAYALFHTWKWADAYEKERQKKPVKRGRPEGKKCKDCRWLSKESKCVIGMECTCPDKKFNSPTAKWKQQSAKACRLFEE